MFDLWLVVQTQWHYEESCRTGLNYPGVLIVMSMWGVPRKDRSRYFGLLQAMEFESLNVWAQDKN